MGRRGRAAGKDGPDGSLNAPFADLGKRLPPRAPARPVPPVPPAPDPDPFVTAMKDVVPLPREAHARVEVARPAGPGRRPVSEEAEALAVLSDLVEGGTRFDITDTREYVEGAIVGLDVRVLRRLRRGDYAWQA